MSITEHIEPIQDGYDEVIESKLLALFDAIEKKQAGGVYIMNPTRVSEFADAYKYLKKTFEPNFNVRYNQREDMGCTGWDMFVRGKNLSFKRTKELVDNVLSKADCFEVSAYLNGDTELAVTFYNMMVKGK